MDNVIIIITACLTLSLILSEICFRIRYPRIIGPIVTGIIFSIGPLKEYVSHASEQIQFLSELSIIFLLLLAGLEINIKKLEKASKDSLLISFFSALIPFAFGFIAVKLMYHFSLITSFSDQSNIVAAVVGACLSLTAEGTTLAMLIELNALNTRLGAIILGSGILDDVFEVFFLSALLIFVNKSSNLLLMPIYIFIFVVIVLLIWKLVPGIIRKIQKEDSRITTVSTIIVITLIIASISSMFGLSPILGAFIGGIIIQLSNKDKDDERQDIEELNVLTFSLIVPFFFINIGLHFDFASLIANPIVVIIILVIAILSKIIGSVIVTPLSGLTLRQTYLIGWAMNSRGAMELVILELARNFLQIPVEIYSAIVIMAIATTIMFPVIFKTIVTRNPHILNLDASKGGLRKNKLKF